MKRSGLYVLILVLSIFSLFLSSCGHNHSSNSSMTSITTSNQAAQAALATLKTARNVMVYGSALAMITSAATSGGVGLPLAPAINTSSAATMQAAAASTYSSTSSPTKMKATGPHARAVTFPVTIDCATNTTVTGGSTATPDSITIVQNSVTHFTVTFNACRENSIQIDGLMTAELTGIIAFTFTLGSDAAPLVVTGYAGATSPTVSDVLQTSSTVLFSQTGSTDTFVATGSFENWDYAAHAHERQVMNNLKIAVTTGVTLVGGANYSVDTLTVNGPLAGTVFASDTDTTVSYTEANSFTNFVIVDKAPAAGSPNFDYLAVSGTFTISTTPADKCIDGTFSVSTNTNVKLDNGTGTAVAGQITINGDVTALFNADGSLSVTVDGGAPITVSEPDLAMLCSL